MDTATVNLDYAEYYTKRNNGSFKVVGTCAAICVVSFIALSFVPRENALACTLLFVLGAMGGICTFTSSLYNATEMTREKMIPTFKIGSTLKLKTSEFEELNPKLTVVKMTLKSYLVTDDKGNFKSIAINEQNDYCAA